METSHEAAPAPERDIDDEVTLQSHWVNGKFARLHMEKRPIASVEGLN